MALQGLVLCFEDSYLGFCGVRHSSTGLALINARNGALYLRIALNTLLLHITPSRYSQDPTAEEMPTFSCIDEGLDGTIARFSFDAGFH
jgi:hypothetical protein